MKTAIWSTGATLFAGISYPSLNHAYEVHSKIKEFTDPKYACILKDLGWEYGCHEKYTPLDLNTAFATCLKIPTSKAYPHLDGFNIKQIQDVLQPTGEKIPEIILKKLRFIGKYYDDRFWTASIGLTAAALSIFCIYKAYQSYNRSHQK